MRILALDQSSEKTGWAKYLDGILLESGVIDLHTNKDSDARLIAMGKEISLLIKSFHPDMVSAEEVSLQNPNVKTVVMLARLQGMIMAAASLDGKQIPVIFYVPSQWRKSVGIQTGKGIKRADLKRASKELVLKEYGIAVSDDIADAILIGRCAVQAEQESKER